MSTDRIDFISAYCDRWCERCAFTERCSAYACQIAIEMCGDTAAGIELAVGTPHPVKEKPGDTAAADRLSDCQDFELSPEASAEYERRKRASDARVKASPLTRMTTTYMLRATGWLTEHRDRLTTAGDPVLREALDVVGWDAYFVGAKLRRALGGQDESRYGDDEVDDFVQNDWNGSAKVALISLERSETAWRVIAGAGVGDVPLALAEALSQLRGSVEKAFPRAASFVRPGFDEPWR
jgi:hypothetical protein